MSPAIFPPWVDRARSNPEIFMPRNDTFRILASLGGGEPLEITPKLAESVAAGKAQRAACWDLLLRLTDSNKVEDAVEKRRRLLELGSDVARLGEAFDQEAERALREVEAWVFRSLEAVAASRGRNLRHVGESNVVKPRSTPTRAGRGRLGATGAREAANGEPAGPDAADGRERPGPEPGRRARGPIERRRRKPETPRD
jgi:hypothetical protein